MLSVFPATTSASRLTKGSQKPCSRMTHTHTLGTVAGFNYKMLSTAQCIGFYVRPLASSYRFIFLQGHFVSGATALREPWPPPQHVASPRRWSRSVRFLSSNFLGSASIASSHTNFGMLLYSCPPGCIQCFLSR